VFLRPWNAIDQPRQSAGSQCDGGDQHRTQGLPPRQSGESLFQRLKIPEPSWGAANAPTIETRTSANSSNDSWIMSSSATGRGRTGVL
jgi:hypothetical protein